MSDETDDSKKSNERKKRDTEIRNVDSDHPYALTSPASPFVGKDGGLTLEFHAPPLRLPEEFVLDAGAQADSVPPKAPSTIPTPSHDAWTVDRIERGGRISTAPPTRAPFSSMPAEAVDAVTLVDRTQPSSPGHSMHDEMLERFALSDFTGAHRVAELLLGKDPTDDVAREYVELCRARIVQLHASRVGGADSVPVVVHDASARHWFSSDPRAADVFQRVDGVTSFEQIVRASPMPELDAWKALVELMDAGAIAVLPRAD